jgi:chitin disaccharide deacetylase
VKRLIVTGDDFGLALPVNEAVVDAHVRGVLTAASLMVSAEAAGDAVERARSTPTLRVGLHLVLVEGRPVLAPEEVPDLVDGRGEFSADLVRAGFRFFFKPAVRRQLEAEIRAQFDAFHSTGLPLDHVNAHNHMHFHPTVLAIVLRVGQEYGMRAVRLPYEPPMLSWRASGKGLASKIAWGLFLAPWNRILKSRLRRESLRSNDFVFGMADSGAMNRDLVRSFVAQLPEGVSEMYFHPATRRCAVLDRTMPLYDHVGEFRALTDSAVREEIDRAGIQRIAFSDL